MKTIQKFLITKDENEVNELLKEGWKVIKIKAQNVAVNRAYPEEGKFAILLEKEA